MKTTDKPKENPQDDELDRANFSKQLAQIIQKSNPNNGFVIALYGEWGSGKSTIINFTKHYIEQDNKNANNKTTIIEFTPWWFSGQENLTQEFIKTIQKTTSNNKILEILTTDTGPLVGVTLATLLTGLLLRLDEASLKSTAPLIPLFVMGIQILTKLISEKIDQNKKPESAKITLPKNLKDKKILVIIDDIDRLLPEETRQLFSLIKGLANLPNITYLLSFDYQKVSREINKNQTHEKPQFIDKIVQLPFNIPTLNKARIQRTLTYELNKITKYKLDTFEIEQIVEQGLIKLINVPRDIFKIIDTISATYNPIQYEVNALDFFIIESIRILTPKAYEQIKSNSSHLTAHHNTYYDYYSIPGKIKNMHTINKEKQLKIEEIVSKSDLDHKDSEAIKFLL